MGQTDTLVDRQMYTYFISNGQHVKIGKSYHPEARLRELQTGSSQPLHLLMTIVGDFEFQYQYIMAPALYGEWFAWDESATNLIFFVTMGRRRRPEDGLFNLIPPD